MGLGDWYQERKAKKDGEKGSVRWRQVRPDRRRRKRKSGSRRPRRSSRRDIREIISRCWSGCRARETERPIRIWR